MKKGILYIDVEKCLACRSCEIACAVEHSESKDLRRSIREGRTLKSRMQVRAKGKSTVPQQCRHCEDAKCIKACKKDALKRTEEGIVLLDMQKCTLCRACVKACPFKVIYFNKPGKEVYKCDLCIERLKEDQSPACVSACPTGAIRFEPAEDGRTAKFLTRIKHPVSK